MTTFNDASSPLQIKRTAAKSLLEQEITSRGFNAGEAVEVLRELFDEIEPADRTRMAKRMNTENAMTADEFADIVYGSEMHPKFTNALYTAMNKLAEGVPNWELRRELFADMNYAIDDLMEDIRSNSPHIVTHPDGSPVIDEDDTDDGFTRKPPPTDDFILN